MTKMTRKKQKLNPHATGQDSIVSGMVKEKVRVETSSLENYDVNRWKVPGHVESYDLGIFFTYVIPTISANLFPIN